MPDTTCEADARPGFRPTSMAGLINALDVGESWCRALRFDPDLTTREEMAAAGDRLKAAVEPAVRRVRDANPDRVFVTEKVDARTAGFHIVVAVVVTRVS